jgi:flavodoxin
MNTKVVYHSKTGNTKKLAEAIADAVGTKAASLADAGKLDAVDLLFIGDGVYMGDMAPETRAFIESLDAKTIKKAAVFGTFGGQLKAVENMKKLLASRGIEVAGESFGCKGQSWFFLNRNQPTPEALDGARDFAKKLLVPHK